MGTLSKTGKGRQKVYDAIKKAREGEYAWATLEGRRLKLGSSDQMRNNGYGPYGLAIVKFDGKLRLSEVSSKGSMTWAITTSGLVSRKIQEKEILAAVIECHERRF